ncbi:MAG: threonine synthase [SAR202 cluster bacterium Io17-Chloro-G3]|nr:MAG: threonine synthase [SAR202 cluster bacterium Io17-Chloro-G3]
MGIGVLHRYRQFLPITDNTPLVSLGEGETPLIASPHLSKEVGCDQVYLKLEGCNPTGSFKDRGMVVAVAKAMEEKSTTIICASTGNTSASAAAYGAHCNLATIVLVPKGAIATGKLAQAKAHGAQVLTINGNFDQALALVRTLSSSYPFSLVNSVNPNRLQGQKTAAFEIVDALGDAPDYLFIPVGNAGNITAYWMGFSEYADMGLAKRQPSMMGFQAKGASPIVQGMPVEHPQTVASAIRIGNPASWSLALAARDQSGGTIGAVSDEEILDAHSLLARQEGIFCEAASAASVAGLRKLAKEGLSLKGKTVVCVITGTGLKEPELAAQYEGANVSEVQPDLESVEATLALATLPSASVQSRGMEKKH